MKLKENGKNCEENKPQGKSRLRPVHWISIFFYHSYTACPYITPVAFTASCLVKVRDKKISFINRHSVPGSASASLIRSVK